MKQIPITVLTGFLGSGKTTFLNKIINENPDIKFGIIVNEFGEVGIDGQLVEKSDQQIVELSNGCLCCIVRGDLIETVDKLISTGNVDYVLIEASGLAEPEPIADTFVANSLGGKVFLDGIICIVDVENFHKSKENLDLVVEQLQICDFIVLNKTSDSKAKELKEINELISDLNPNAKVFQNSSADNLNSKLLIDTGNWPLERLENYQQNSQEHEHHHEHNDFDEIVFKTDKIFDPKKLDSWFDKRFPAKVIRSKGLLRIQTPRGPECFVFQMVGSSKMLTPLAKEKAEKLNSSTIVFIGTNLEKEVIFGEIENTLV